MLAAMKPTALCVVVEVAAPCAAIVVAGHMGSESDTAVELAASETAEVRSCMDCSCAEIESAGHNVAAVEEQKTVACLQESPASLSVPVVGVDLEGSWNRRGCRRAGLEAEGADVWGGVE